MNGPSWLAAAGERPHWRTGRYGCLWPVTEVQAVQLSGRCIVHSGHRGAKGGYRQQSCRWAPLFQWAWTTLGRPLRPTAIWQALAISERSACGLSTECCAQASSAPDV